MQPQISAIIQYKASDTILHIDSDTSYLSEPRERSRTGGHYYLSSLPNNPEKYPNLPPPENGPIHTEFRILKHVVASADEAEVGGLFQNGQTAAPLRITLHELSFTQQPTPIKKDNSAAEGIITATVRQKISKAMDMRFYWMKDRVKQKDFFVYWKPGSQNMGDYFSKHHPPHHHREISATYLYMENALLKINHKILHKWSNAVLMPIHMVAVTPVHTVAIKQNRSVLPGCANVVHMY